MAASLQAGGAEIVLDGPYYLDVLRAVHARRRPRAYFEIGALHGETLKLARCPSVAVDPKFRLADDVLTLNPQARLFEETSDAFFAGRDLRAELGRRPDVAFLDGMHQFDFILRDFINTERLCRRSSIVLLHDCIPGDVFMTRPFARVGEGGSTRFPGWWTGDVWKLIPVLKVHRPDLRIACLDALPTGLVAITGLDPDSRILSRRCDELTAEWGPPALDDYGVSRLFELAEIESATDWAARLREADDLRRLAGRARELGARLRSAVRARLPPPPRRSPQR